ncbi:Proteasome assembly chaperone 2 [Trichinella pseudospiralis]|uniref:Proteasome assembly chaperone 2 n=1 Tax=Trichinella pseudospiralis TaxID=6337 RepID=A0A0V1DZH8_TRIPS|nr:Proteasome assembly chaperone 2 [Trichinella pseudospiralis]KRZ22523.1 Proteasome assembly chaperone 2 [Trichinella pseudospiralis]KRZ37894.1 Proteasome assembly chaperone 2 [Trichinella pseudospiralis]
MQAQTDNDESDSTNRKIPYTYAFVQCLLNKRITFEIEANKMIDKEIKSNAVFIIPSVSVGFASQQAVDLLICTLDIPFLCHVNANDCFIPMLTTDPYHKDSTKMVTACSAYYSETRNLLIFQFRSDILAHKRVEFVERLQEWIIGMKFQEVILLSTAWAPFRPDPETYINVDVYYMLSKEASKTDEDMRKLRMKKFNTKEMLPKEEQKLTGSGFTLELFKKLDDANVPLIVLIRYCDESMDNRSDAIAQFEALVAMQFERSEIPELRLPYTWER